MKNDQQGFNATKAMAHSLAVKEPPEVKVDFNSPPRYVPSEHTVYVPGYVMADMPDDLRTMYRAYLDHEVAEPEVSNYGPKLRRLYGGNHEVPDKLKQLVNSINDGLRVDAWQGQRFPGARINIEAQVREDLKELVAAYKSQPRKVSPERAGIAFVATIGRYIADGIITVSQAKQMFPRFKQMLEQVEDDLLWVEDHVDSDDPASSKLEDDIIFAAERIYYKLRDVEPPKPGASQQERQEKADQARKPGDERQQGQGQGQGQGDGRSGQSGGAGSSQGNGSGSPSNEGGDRSQEEQEQGDSDGGSSGEDTSQDEGDDSGESGDLKEEESGTDDSSDGQEEGDGDEGDSPDSQPNEVDSADPQDSQASGGSPQDTVVDQKIHPEGDFEWSPEQNLAEKIRDETGKLERSGSTYVEYQDPHDAVSPRETFGAPAVYKERVNKKTREYRRYGGTLATRIRQALTTPGPVKVDRQRRGTLDQRRVDKLATGKRDAFKRTQPRERQDVAVSLAVDESGSMAGSQRDCASDLTWTWAEACDRLDAPLEVIGWTSGTSGIRILKGFDDSIRDDRVKENLASLDATGGTPLASALMVAGERLASRREDQKILFCLTDGGYDHIDVRHALDMCRAHGVTVVFLGAGVANPFEGRSDEVADLFDTWITVNDPKHLALTASKKLVKLIQQEGR